MSFEVYAARSSRANVGPGQPTISSVGQLILLPADLAKVNIKREVVILIDRATKRIGLRRPQESEDGLREPTSLITQNKLATRVKTSIKGALKEIGVELDQARRNVQTIINSEQGLITLSFGGVEGIKKGRGK